MTLSAHAEREFGDLLQQIRRYEDGSELAAAQANIETKFEAVLAELERMQRQIDDFPKRFEEMVRQHIVPLVEKWKQ